MGERSVIEWTDSTWNPWRGCDKVSPGCAHCYMFRDQSRYGRDPGVVTRCADSTFMAPIRSRKWREHREACIAERGRHLVFTCSWSDFFHPDADEWRAEAWEVIRSTPRSIYQILTKRPELIADRLPPDWGNGWPNVWLGTSIENRRFVGRADVLRQTPAAVRFISAEPLLGPLIAPLISPGGLVREGILIGRGARCLWEDGRMAAELDLRGIDWLIVGGESGPGHRPMRVEWARRALDAALMTRPGWEQWSRPDAPPGPPPAVDGGTAFFFKQWGGPRPDSGGRLLDGREWSEMPELAEPRTAAQAVGP